MNPQSKDEFRWTDLHAAVLGLVVANARPISLEAIQEELTVQAGRSFIALSVAIDRVPSAVHDLARGGYIRRMKVRICANVVTLACAHVRTGAGRGGSRLPAPEKVFRGCARIDFREWPGGLGWVNRLRLQHRPTPLEAK